MPIWLGQTALLRAFGSVSKPLGRPARWIAGVRKQSAPTLL